MEATSSCEKLTQWATSFQVAAKNSAAVSVLKPYWKAAATDVCVNKQLSPNPVGGYQNDNAH